MRKAGTIADPRQAARLADYLLSIGIPAQIDEDGAGGHTVWVEEAAHVDPARAEIEAFQRDPEDGRYRQAEDRAREIRAEEARTEEQARRRFVDVRLRWTAGAPARARLTLALIVVSIAVAAASQLGKRPELLAYLFIARVEVAGGMVHWAGLSDLRQGQVWRLVTPIFIHFGLPHVLFNMLWLWDLGRMVEGRRGTLRFGLLVLALAVASNLGQYLWAGPQFGGMSGVVYGLFGYVWMKGRHEPQAGMALQSQTVFWMIAWFVLCLTGALGPVANAAHGVGLGAGVLLGSWRSLRTAAPPRT